MEKIYIVVKPVVSFLMVETIVLQLLPAGEFRKMVKRFSGIVLILLLLKPVLSLTDRNVDSGQWIQKAQIEQELKNCENLIKSGDAYLAEKSGAQYRQLIRAQIEKEAAGEGLDLKECEIGISDAGELESICIRVSTRSKKDGKIKVQAEVQKIEAGKDREEPEEPQIINMKNRIIQTYGLDEEQATVKKD